MFEFFKGKVDSKTGVMLFHEKNKKILNMLAMVKKGYTSDPPSLSMYIPKTKYYGEPMVDNDGFVLYR